MYIFTCEYCKNGDHKHCIKGFPAPKGVYGGSKCICPVCNPTIIPPENLIDRDLSNLKNYKV